MFAEILFSLLVEKVPPGHTALSVMPVHACAAAQEVPCEDARWSSFYGTWVRKEDEEAGRQRYRLAVAALVDSASALLCLTPEGAVLEGCKPAPGARSPRGARWWGVQRLSLLATAVAVMESGFREDVQVGRGWAKKASDDGGRGRGPGMEGCFMQAHPVIAWRFAEHAPSELRARAEGGDREAREAVMQTLLGTSEEALRNCWSTGLRMLLQARAHCAWASPKTPSAWATVSMYGTGTSCVSPNDGKTAMRVRLYESFSRSLRATKSTAGSGAS